MSFMVRLDFLGYFSLFFNLKMSLGGDSEKEGNFRRLTLEEARRLTIVSFSNTPEDEETPSK